ncbi:MAG: hypothetical protein LUD79_06100, partial [Oscillospiraceae bacterium]|nr:hypothetical protein [Oscillospiraceae bacterium]
SIAMDFLGVQLHFTIDHKDFSLRSHFGLFQWSFNQRILKSMSGNLCLASSYPGLPMNPALRCPLGQQRAGVLKN